MKKITIISVGRLKEKFFTLAAEEYLKRLSRFCEVKVIELPDAEGKLSEPEIITRESNSVLAALKNQKFWLLDIDGELFSSEKFATELNNVFLYGEAVFVIGGSCGVDQRVRSAAEKRVSFGRFTYPHRLMRIMLLEQLYRATTINEGMPYHK